MDVSVNVDRFKYRAVHEVIGLLPTTDDATAACRDLDEARAEVREAEMLYGDDGVRIFDYEGTQHGYAARLSRMVSHTFSQENVLHLHHDGLVRGETLLSLGCDRETATEVAAVLKNHGGHAIAYFGRGTLEAMSLT